MSYQQLSTEFTAVIPLYGPSGPSKETPLPWPDSHAFPSLALVVVSDVGASGKLNLAWHDNRNSALIVRGFFVVEGPEFYCRLDLPCGTFPPTPSGQMSFGGAVGGGYHKCTVKVSVTSLEPTSLGRSLASGFVGSLVRGRSSNVCLYFPRSERRLWVDEASLAAVSPYFRTLFASGFLETASVTEDKTSNDTEREPKSQKEEEGTRLEEGTKGKAGKLASDTDKRREYEYEYEYEDSDVEIEEALTQVYGEPSRPTVPTIKTIAVTQHTYETYLALLCWIGTGFIEFAPLRSKHQYELDDRFSDSDGELVEDPQRINSIVNSYSDEPLGAPASVSPKSIYRLAHYLEIDKLSKLALANFESQLSCLNVIHELYSDIASHYPEIRDIALDFVVLYWDEVRGTRAYSDVMRRGEQEGIDGVTGLLLSARLMEMRDQIVVGLST